MVKDRGLKLCPMIVSRMCVLAFHRGLVEDLSDPGVDEQTERVGVPAVAREGVMDEGMDSRRDAVSDLR